MSNDRDLRWVLLSAVFVLCGAASNLQAYVDPGTQVAVVSGLAGVLAMFAGFFGIVLWPARKLLDFVCKRTGMPRVYGKIIIVALTLGGVAYLVYVLDQEYHFLPTADAEDDAGPAVPVVSYAKFDRVLVLGMDGLDANIMEKMVEAGELPNFAKLKQAGSYARLRTSNPPQSPVAWSCIATGCNPGKHAIFDFILRDPKTYIPKLAIYDPTPEGYKPTRMLPGFWVPLSKAGMPTTVVRWPNAFPPDKINGNFFSGLGVPDILDRLGRYSLYTTNKKHFAPANTPNKMVEVAWKGDKISTALFGPTLSSLTGKREEATLPLVLTKKGKQIELALDGKVIGTLGVGDWSKWVPVKFGGALTSKSGIVRFLLMAVEPDLKIYAAPIQVDPLNPAFAITEPPGYAKELADAVGGRYFTIGMPEDVKAFSEEVFGPADFLSMCKLIDAERMKMFEYELARFEKGLLAFVFDSTDRKQHMFWATLDPEHPAYNAEHAKKYGHVIPGVYTRMDEILGQVLPKLGDRTALLVLSDHGFNTYRRTININTWLVDNGYQKLTTPDGKDGKAFFANVDWSKTRAYALGFNSIYINMKGREGNGIVGKGSEYRKLCDEIVEKLGELRDPKTKKRAVRAVYLASEIYKGDYLADGPDLVVGLALGIRSGGENVLGASPRAMFEDNTKPWSGDHLYDPYYVSGVFLSNQKIRKDNPSVIDIAPSVLQCFGIPKPTHMDGEAMFVFDG